VQAPEEVVVMVRETGIKEEDKKKVDLKTLDRTGEKETH
jgi:hypothetical protein